MSLSIGIVGLPNVGKSTLFNALTKKCVPAENYPFCTIDPSVGVVAVPDERVGKLAGFSKSKKVIPAAVEFVDIAGIVKGAAEGEGLGNKFLSNIREADAIAEVVRVFVDDKVVHVHGNPDPIKDIETINLELILADLETVTKRIGSASKEAKRGDKEAIAEFEQLLLAEKDLKEGRFAKMAPKNLHLLTTKPILYVLNGKAGKENVFRKDSRIKDYMDSIDAAYVEVDAGIEAELSVLSDDEREEYRKGFGVERDGLDDLIKKGYEMLGLMTYFTTGEDETRAWTVKIGSTAPEAGRAIHSDFQEKFIRAEIINWKTLFDVGSYSTARDRGLLRTEGKDYIVEDGDVIEFKI